MDKLLVLNGTDPVRLRSAIEAQAHVKQEASPRVLVIEANPDVVEQIISSPEIASPEENPDRLASLGLTPSEELFIQAWTAGQRMDKSDRVGEGLSWDHDGFEAP